MWVPGFSIASCILRSLGRWCPGSLVSKNRRGRKVWRERPQAHRHKEKFLDTIGIRPLVKHKLTILHINVLKVYSQYVGVFSKCKFFSFTSPLILSFHFNSLIFRFAPSTVRVNKNNFIFLLAKTWKTQEKIKTSKVQFDFAKSGLNSPLATWSYNTSCVHQTKLLLEVMSSSTLGLTSRWISGLTSKHAGKFSLLQTIFLTLDINKNELNHEREIRTSTFPRTFYNKASSMTLLHWHCDISLCEYQLMAIYF